MTSEMLFWIIVISLVALAIVISASKQISNVLYAKYLNKKNNEDIKYIGLKSYGIAIKNMISNIKMNNRTVEERNLNQILLFNRYKFRRRCIGVEIFCSFVMLILIVAMLTGQIKIQMSIVYVVLLIIVSKIAKSVSKAEDKLNVPKKFYKMQYGYLLDKTKLATSRPGAHFHYIYLADVELEDGTIYNNVYFYNEEYYDAAESGQRCLVYAETFLKAYVVLPDYEGKSLYIEQVE